MEIKKSEVETLLVDTTPPANTNILDIPPDQSDKVHSNVTSKKRILDVIAFILFVLQTSSVVLLIRYSRLQIQNDQYATASIIASSEIGKIIVGTLYSLYDYKLNQKQPLCTAISSIYYAVFGKRKILLLMSVPSIVYSIQNFLMFKALGLIDSSIYQIVVQLKTFTTACFGMCLLSKKYTWIQWISFLLLSAGVVIANLSVIKSKKESDDITKDEGSFGSQTSIQFTGLLYVLGTTVTSGFAGTFMELQLKGNKNNIFIQNIHLSLFMLIGCVLNGYVNGDVTLILEYGFFYGYTKVVWIIVILNIFGGYFVALVIKRASTMIKTFLSGIAILLIIFESFLFLGDNSIEHLDFFGAVFLVLMANYLYNKEKENQKKLMS